MKDGILLYAQKWSNGPFFVSAIDKENERICMQRILKLRLSTKIMIYIFVFIVLATTIIMSYLTKVYKNLIEEEIESATAQQVEMFVTMIDNHLDAIHQRLDSYVSEPAVVRLMNANYTRPGTVRSIRESLPESCVDIHAVNLYLYVNNLNSMYAAFGTEIPDKIVWIISEMKQDQSINTSEFRIITDTNAIYCIKVIRDYRTSLFRGLIIAHIPAWELLQYIENNQNIHGDLYAITERGILFYEPLRRKQPFEVQSITLQNDLMQRMESSLVYIKQLENSDLFLVGVNDGLSFMESNLELPFHRIFLIIVICVAVALILLLALVRSALNPLSELTAEIRKADPDHLIPLNKQYKDEEIRVLTGAYNEMVERVNDNIDKKYKAELALKEAQINTLQYQINPHFVNNTLQLIGSMAADRDMPDLYEIVVAFSRIFYYSIKFKGGSFVQLRDELEFLDDYLILQQARYPDKLKYEKNVEKSCCDIEVPKIIIQPLIENCFSHAFARKDGIWIIKVNAWISNSILTISVEDNGAGMTSNQAQALEEELDNPDNTLKVGTSHIGIRNVNARLCLLYGISYRLRFSNREGEGITFYVHIPVQREEEI